MIRVSALLLALALLAPQPALAQDETPATPDVRTPTGPCAVASACRLVGTIPVEDAQGNVETVEVNRTFPWVVRDNIMLFSGESVTVRLEPSGDILAPRLVRGGAESAATAPVAGEIRFTFSSSVRGNVMLEVESRYPRTLDYAALAVTRQGPNRTSVCSLQPGITVYESWTTPVVQFAAWNFVPTDEPGCKTLQLGETAEGTTGE